MRCYRATYTRHDGTPGVLPIVALSDWAAIDAMLAALDGTAAHIQLRRC